MRKLGLDYASLEAQFPKLIYRACYSYSEDGGPARDRRHDPVLPHVRARTLVALALTSDKRYTIVPAVPTARELGLADLNLVGWIGVAGPANMPAEVLQWWTAQLTAALAAPEVGEIPPSRASLTCLA